MATENKTFLLSIKLDTSGLPEASKKASAELINLKEKQKELKKAGAENTVEYAKLKEEIRLTNKTLNDSASAMLIAEKQNGNTNKSLKDLTQVQKALAVQFNNLTEEEIQNSEAGKKIAKQYKEVNDALNKNSLAVGDGRRNVGQYKRAILEANQEISSLKKEITQIGFAYGKTTKQVEDSTQALDELSAEGKQGTQAFVQLENEIAELNETLKFQESALNGANEELKQQEEQLKATEKEAQKIGFVYGENANSVGDLRSELIEMQNVMSSTDANSEEYIQASIRAGELRDKLKEVKENTNALAGGSGFEKMSNLMGGLTGDLANLDFEGVSEKAKALQNVSANMTFKEVTGGLKSMGSALISLGKTILANPLFLMVAVIGAVVGALVYFSQETEVAEAQNEKLNESFDRSSKALAIRNQRMIDNAKFQVELAKAQGKSLQEINDLEEQAIEKERKANIESSKASLKLILDKKQAYIQSIVEGDEELQKKISKEITDEKFKLRQLNADRSKFNQDKLLLEVNFQAKLKEEADKEATRIKEANKKASDDYKKSKEDALKLAEEIAKRTRDLQLKTIELTNSNERSLIESQSEFKVKIAELTIQEEQKRAEAILQIKKEEFASIEALEVQENETALKRIKDKADEEKKASKGTKTQIKIQNDEIDKQYLLEKQALELEFENGKIERQNELKDIEAGINEEILNNFAKTNAEKLTLLEAELLKQTNALTEAGKTEEEIQKANAQKEIEIARQKNKIIQDDKTKTDAEKKLSEEQLNAEILAINKKAGEDEVELEKKKAEDKKAINEALVSAVQSITNTAFQIAQNQVVEDLNAVKFANEEKANALQDQLDKGLISQEKYNQLKKELDVKAKKEESALNKKAFELQKTQSLISAGINTAVAITKSLPNLILAGIVGGLGAIEIASILSQPTPAFASGGKVVSGKRIDSSDGRSISRSNGDNLIATIKTGEVILNESQQNLLGGSSTFAKIGVPGFSDGGIVGNSIESKILNDFDSASLIINAFKNLPSPVVLVQDINEGQTNLTTVIDSANI